MAEFVQAAREAGWRGIVVIFALAMSAYHLVFAWVSYPIGEIHRPLHLLFALVVLFAVKPKQKLPGVKSIVREIWDIALITAVIAGCGYLIVNAYEIQERVPYITDMTPTEIVLSFVTVIAVMEAARRTVGWGLVLLAAVFLLYALFGDALPEPFDHRRYSVGRIMESIYLTKEGLWNIPLGVSANYIFIFVLFGSLLLASGAGSFFTDFAQALTGRYTGGTAKTAVVSSSFMGMLQGSSVSNVVTTGSFTIPAMRKSGYSAPFAAGVEAVASSGGQLTPPILGSAAFLMVEFIGVPYLEVIKASVIPAILYYLAVFMMVDLEARRLGLKSVSEGSAAIWPMLRRRGYLMIPPLAILWFLFQGFTPTMAGFWAFVTLAALCVIMDAENRRNFLKIMVQTGLEAPKLIGPVAVACAVGGIIAGVTLTTGLGLKVSKIILMASGGYLSVTLLLTLIISIILGMGMPTSGAYIVLAALLAPGLVNLGVPEMAAHLFIIFAAASASITPPVAIASYAAAAVANSNPWETSIIALKLGLSVFIIPFMFVYSPALLGFGGFVDITMTMLPAAVGIVCLSIAVIGFLKVRLTLFERAGFFATSLLFIHPNWTTSLVAVGVVMVMLVMVFARARKSEQGEVA